MTEENPFTPPKNPSQPTTSDTDQSGVLRPATRWARLWAYLIDQTVLSVLSLGVVVYFNLWNMLWAVEPEQLSLISEPFYNPLTLKFILYCLVCGPLLFTQGQTPGKLIMSIRIIDINGRTPPLWKLILIRYALFFFLPLGIFPYLGSLFFLINAGAIFLPGSRCLHDRLAGTFVAQSA